MAWSEQCKFSFRANATAKLGKFKNKNRKIKGVLQQLSKESDIPFNTLSRWWYEKGDSISVKNDRDKPSICIRCGENPVLITSRGRPLTEDSKHYGLCNSCRAKQNRAQAYNRDADEINGRIAECPHCHGAFYIKP